MGDDAGLKRREEIAQAINTFIRTFVDAPWVPTLTAEQITLTPSGASVSVKPVDDVVVTVEVGNRSLMQVSMVSGLLGGVGRSEKR